VSSFRGERKPSTGNKPAKENIMTKIILGKTPKTFAAFPVDFPMPDGTTGEIKATFKYRTRTQFGEFLNKIFSEAGEEQVRMAISTLKFYSARQKTKMQITYLRLWTHGKALMRH